MNQESGSELSPGLGHNEAAKIARYKVIVHEHFDEVWNKGNLEKIYEHLHPNYSAQNLPPEFAPTREGYKHFVASMRFAFPECEFKVDQVIAEGDNVCVMYTASAYPEGKAPDERFSGKRETMSSVNLIRFDPETGQVIEHRASGNLTRASNRD